MMIAVKLLVETPGRKDGNEILYPAGEILNLEDSLALHWIAERRAEEVYDFPPSADYEDFTVAELRDMARERGIPYSGLLKAELIEALEDDDAPG